MRAVVFDRSGGPSVLRVDDVADPGAPTADRILVRVAASSINGTDLGLRRGAPGSAVFGRRVRLGSDVFGEVVRCGPAVMAFAPGDRIAALLPHSGSGQAELVTVCQRRATLVPPEVTSVEAAALPLAGLTALEALFGRAGLSVRQAPRVLVHGAAGGIGSFAVQLAASAGARSRAPRGPPSTSSCAAWTRRRSSSSRAGSRTAGGTSWSTPPARSTPTPSDRRSRPAACS